MRRMSVQQSKRRSGPVTIRDVAARAGVSLGTVSNVLNHPHLVAEEKRRRVLEAIEELGFVRSSAARQLRGRRSHSIGVVVLDVANPFFTEVLRGIEDVLAANGYTILICSSDESPEREDYQLRVFEEKRVDGVIITPSSGSGARLGRLRQRGIPFVLLDSPALELESCWVAVDDVRGGYLAISCLIERGHRRIALLNGPEEIRQCADRLAGARSAMEEAGLDPDQLVVLSLGLQTAQEGDKVAERLLDIEPRPTAVFCVNDLVALGVLRRLRQAGVEVPGDMAVVGYDDIDVASIVKPELTSIRQPKYELGKVAAELLLEEVEAGPRHEHRHVLFEPELIVREST